VIGIDGGRQRPHTPGMIGGHQEAGTGWVVQQREAGRCSRTECGGPGITGTAPNRLRNHWGIRISIMSQEPGATGVPAATRKIKVASEERSA